MYATPTMQDSPRQVTVLKQCLLTTAASPPAADRLGSQPQQSHLDGQTKRPTGLRTQPSWFRG